MPLQKFLALFKQPERRTEVSPKERPHKASIKPPKTSKEDIMKLDDVMTVYCSGEYNCHGEIKTPPGK